MKDRENAETDAFSIISVEFGAGSDVDVVLADVARQLAARGTRVAGLIQRRGLDSDNCNCRNMDLLDLRTGKYHRISEERGASARGCHLDWQAIMALSHDLEASLNDDVDVLIINRFGRAESNGRGFRGAIEKALGLGIRVVVAVRGEYLGAWRDFHAGLALSVQPDPRAILEAL